MKKKTTRELVEILVERMGAVEGEIGGLKVQTCGLAEKLTILNAKVDKIDNRIDNLETEIRVVKEDVRTFRLENKEEHEVLMGAIHYLGDKIFGNHEARLVKLETA